LGSHLVPTEAHLIFACEKASSSKDEIVVVSGTIVRRVMVSFMVTSEWNRLVQVGRYE
jgi:hypothetical protein